MAGLITATYEKDTPKQYRYKVDKNKFGITGTLYIPKEKTKGKPKPIMKLKVALGSKE
jgi:hypothetical protein